MNYLLIDTSGLHLTVVIIKNGEVFTEFLPDGNLKHSITLMPAVENLLNKSGLKISEIDGFSAVIGPGSFTGIRIGVATVKAFANAFNKPVLPVTSFDVLAYNKRDGKRLAIIDAMHDNFYACAYNGNEITVSPCFLTKAEVLNLAGEYEILSSTNIEGLNVTKVDLLKGLINAVNSKVNDFILNADALEPLYVRKSQAEEGRV
ncbi:MAG: tRNA (adenosine(37)-N6)-threonylcarbamoyltransferase complex dimerization subunit type 1 TsaB [Clostridia bacterium]|nr:tRNA (adenosine(37)-N6)-threonylcarbamoyltransferase complex dimerization subunit type 1 TsaB [Clostridia bacterium]